MAQTKDVALEVMHFTVLDGSNENTALEKKQPCFFLIEWTPRRRPVNTQWTLCARSVDCGHPVRAQWTLNELSVDS